MTINLEILIIIYALSSLVLIVFSILKLSNSKQTKGRFDLNDLTVIVPFRNEESRIVHLLNSLKKQTALPFQYLFLNDHSIDKGVGQIYSMLEQQKVNYSILDLPEKYQGKKSAIRYAMKAVQTKYFLIQDADVELPATYFCNLKELPHADLYILPVAMKSKSVFQLFSVLDHLMINAVNWSVSAFYPLTASGANLIVRKSTFMELTYSDYKEEFASGDDQFILRDFRTADKEILTIGSKRHTVLTESPGSFKELIDQRVRWAGKTAKVGDVLDLFVGGLALMYSVSFFLFSLIFLVKGNFALAGFVFGVKLGLDILFYSFYFIYQNRVHYLFLLPVMNIVFPLYAVMLAILVVFYKPKWKGREIYLTSSKK